MKSLLSTEQPAKSAQTKSTKKPVNANAQKDLLLSKQIHLESI